MTQVVQFDRPSKTSTVDVQEGAAPRAAMTGSVATVADLYANEILQERWENPQLIRGSQVVDPASVDVQYLASLLERVVAYDGATYESLYFDAGTLADQLLSGEVTPSAEFLRLAGALAIQTGEERSERTLDDELKRELVLLLDEEPVEIGEQHDAEALLAAFVGTSGFGSWLREFYNSEPNLRRSLVLCIGRLPLTAGQQLEVREIIANALVDSSLQVREAGVRALERLDSIASDLLASYDERVQWLKEYAARVLRRSSPSG